MTPAKKLELSDQFELPFEALNYLINIDHDRRIVYFETPKVACTSIKKYMIDQSAGAPVAMLPHEVHDRSKSPLKALDNYTDSDIDTIFAVNSPFRRFCFVRDPYSRVLSAYLDKIVGNEWERERHLPLFGFEPSFRPHFVEFLHRLSQITDRDRDIHYVSQARLTGRLSGFSFDFVGRFENFQRDFHALKSIFYFDDDNEDYQIFGKHHASNANEKVNFYYGGEERKLVSNIYAADFEIFGYSV